MRTSRNRSCQFANTSISWQAARALLMSLSVIMISNRSFCLRCLVLYVVFFPRVIQKLVDSVVDIFENRHCFNMMFTAGVQGNGAEDETPVPFRYTLGGQQSNRTVVFKPNQLQGDPRTATLGAMFHGKYDTLPNNKLIQCLWEAAHSMLCHSFSTCSFYVFISRCHLFSSLLLSWRWAWKVTRSSRRSPNSI